MLNYNVFNEYIKRVQEQGIEAAYVWFYELEDFGGWEVTAEGAISPGSYGHTGQVGCQCRDCVDYRSETGYDTYEQGPRASQWPRNTRYEQGNVVTNADESLCNSRNGKEPVGSKKLQLYDEKVGQADENDGTRKVFAIAQILKTSNVYDRTKNVRRLEKGLVRTQKEGFDQSELGILQTIIRILYIAGSLKKLEVRSAADRIECRCTTTYDKKWKAEWAESIELSRYDNRFIASPELSERWYSEVFDYIESIEQKERSGDYAAFYKCFQEDEGFRSWQQEQFRQFLEQSVHQRCSGQRKCDSFDEKEIHQSTGLFNGKITKYSSTSSDSGESIEVVNGNEQSVGKYVKARKLGKRSRRLRRLQN